MLLIKKTKLVISTNVAKANDGILAIISFDKRIKRCYISCGTKYLDSSKYFRADDPNSNVDKISAIITGTK